jgi:hypothetical protein
MSEYDSASEFYEPDHDLDSWSTPDLLESACKMWQQAKDAERKATEYRRDLEDKMLSLIGIPETLDGTESAEAPGGYHIKVVGRINRSVNGDLAQEIAAEHGLTEHLATLFRWKPELNMKAWANASPDITGPMAAAITAKPGRPSFTITTDEE